MKEHPILFSASMVQALLAGRKTQTRRAHREQPSPHATSFNFDPEGWPKKPWYARRPLLNSPGFEITNTYKCPFGKPGDLLWVKECFHAFGFWEDEGSQTKYGKDKKRFIDRTTAVNNYHRYAEAPPNVIPLLDNPKDGGYGWYKRNSLFMPKAAARIWLEVESVRVERLQDISEEDAISEGIEPSTSDLGPPNYYRKYPHPSVWTDSPIVSFYSLWQSINGEESWEENPWLWVVKFKVLSTIGKPF